MAIEEEPAAPIPREVPNDPPAPAPARRRHVTRGILVLMILTVAGVVAPFVANIFASHSGAGLDTAKVFQVRIDNDTAAPLDAKLCDHCLPTVPKVSILPGASAQVNVSAGGTVTRYYLIDRSGATVGCLPLRFSRTVSGFSMPASRAEKCPGDPINAP
ncbi:MAG TPA: hypothetical protein VGK51_09610 [Actinomycetota bacterium]